MDCLFTDGIAKGCRNNSGGLKRALIQNKSEITSFTPAIGGVTDEGAITAVVMESGAQFFEFIPNKMSSNWVENIQSNVQNGTIGYEQVLNLIFSKNEAAKRNQIKLLGQAETVVIVEDYNGKYFVLGEENGVELTGGNSGSGTALTDLNGWNVTLGGMEHYPAREIFVEDKATTDALIAALLVAAA